MTRPARRYTDSGMRWLDEAETLAGPGGDAGPDSLTSVPVEQAAADLAAYLRSYAADTLVAYDRHGGYGHPDHVACHHIARAAAALTGIPLVEVVSEPLLPVPGAEEVALPQWLPAVQRALGHYASQLDRRRRGGRPRRRPAPADRDHGLAHRSLSLTEGAEACPLSCRLSWRPAHQPTIASVERSPDSGVSSGRERETARANGRTATTLRACRQLSRRGSRSSAPGRPACSQRQPWSPTPTCGWTSSTGCRPRSGCCATASLPTTPASRPSPTTLARVFESERVRFLGLVEFGRDVTAAELVAAYDAVIYAVGAADDRHLGIPGEDLPGSRSARQFVAWYSGHPDAEPQPMAGVRDAVVIGVGNVAVDVARILLKEPAALSATDMPDAVLAALREAEIEHVWLVGRRGPEHATFTTPELRELLETPGIGITLTGCDLDAIDDDRPRTPRPRQRRRDRPGRRRIAGHRRPLAAPAVLAPSRSAGRGGPGAGRPLRADRPAPVPEESVSAASGRHEGALTVPADLVLRSIGYRGVPLPGVPYDEGRIPNLEGRVLELDGSARPGEYAVGWIKRGPVGLIGSNKKDAAETVAHLLEDLATQPRRHLTDLDAALAARGVRPSDLEDWRRIDEAEIARGGIRGSERTKIEAWHDLLDLVRRDAGPA